MEENNLNRNLIGVLFPGVVKNEEKAIQCLGGIKQLSQVYSESSKKRLGLSFTPENTFIKKAFADPQPASGMLLKVRLKKTRVGNEVKREVISTTVVGTVKRMYTFDSMADYQYLPIHREGAGPHQCLIERLLPSGLDDISFLYEPAPLFLPPANFTRFDRTMYSYTIRKFGTRDDFCRRQKSDSESDGDDDIHQRARGTRSVPRVGVDFNLTDEFPTEPHEYYIEQKEEKIKCKIYTEKDFETIKKLFDERPVWSTNLIRYHTKYSCVPLKFILPCYAYNMRTGPWRNQWIKLGYDPRKERGARFYQTLDFRMRIAAGVKSMVRGRYYSRSSKRAERLHTFKRRRRAEITTSDADDEVTESMAYFRPGLVPSQRQIFYMFCDVQLPEVQAMVAKEPPPGALCHHKRGWLAPGVADACRELLTKQVMQTMLVNRTEDLRLEPSKSGEESNSDDDNTGNSTPATEVDEASTSSAVNPSPSTSFS